MYLVAIILGVLGLAAAAALLTVKGLTVICQPNEVLVFSGVSRREGGQRLGYRLVHGGRAMRVPLVERVDRLDLTNMVIDLEIRGAYSRGGIPLNVQGVANVKVASQQPAIGNAIERFLGVPRERIKAVAKETLEGNLRGVLSTLTPEEVNQDRVKFSHSLLHEADADLQKLGIDLDMLKIQHVSDDVGYLDSIGRQQSAGLVMRSRLAEAENEAIAAVRSAENWQAQKIAQITAETEIQRARAERQLLDVRTRAEALEAEERANVAIEVAKAHAEVEVQRARVEQIRGRLIADVIRPAEARKLALQAEAKGSAASIVAEGRATAESIRAAAQSWREAGDDAVPILIAHKLRALVAKTLSVVPDLSVSKVTVIDPALRGNGDLAVRAGIANASLQALTGVDVGDVLGRLGASRPAGAEG